MEQSASGNITLHKTGVHRGVVKDPQSAVEDPKRPLLDEKIDTKLISVHPVQGQVWIGLRGDTARLALPKQASKTFFIHFILRNRHLNIALQVLAWYQAFDAHWSGVVLVGDCLGWRNKKSMTFRLNQEIRRHRPSQLLN